MNNIELLSEPKWITIDCPKCKGAGEFCDGFPGNYWDCSRCKGKGEIRELVK